jgi:hypothetical protein
MSFSPRRPSPRTHANPPPPCSPRRARPLRGLFSSAEPGDTRAAPSQPSAHPAVSADNRPAAKQHPTRGIGARIVWTDRPAGKAAPGSPMRRPPTRFPQLEGRRRRRDGRLLFSRRRRRPRQTSSGGSGNFRTPNPQMSSARNDRRRHEQTIVEVEGAYASGMPGAPNAPPRRRPSTDSSVPSSKRRPVLLFQADRAEEGSRIGPRRILHDVIA